MALPSRQGHQQLQVFALTAIAWLFSIFLSFLHSFLYYSQLVIHFLLQDEVLNCSYRRSPRQFCFSTRRCYPIFHQWANLCRTQSVCSPRSQPTSFHFFFFCMTWPPNSGRASIKKRHPHGELEERKRIDDGKNLIQRDWVTWDPVRDHSSPNVACNDPGSPAKLYAEAPAGSTISACYNNPWAHNSGPLTVYMAECTNGDCTTMTDLTNVKWFAIYKEGTTGGKWATQAYMGSNSNCITHIIPKTLKPGNYLIRHETINLAVIEYYANVSIYSLRNSTNLVSRLVFHFLCSWPSSKLPANMLQCANIKVTGSGTATPDSSFLQTMKQIYGSKSPIKSIFSFVVLTIPGGGLSTTSGGSAPSNFKIPGPNVWPANTATGGQVFPVSGVKNACNGQSQDSGTCLNGGKDTSNPTPPNPK